MATSCSVSTSTQVVNASCCDCGSCPRKMLRWWYNLFFLKQQQVDTGRQDHRSWYACMWELSGVWGGCGGLESEKKLLRFAVIKNSWLLEWLKVRMLDLEQKGNRKLCSSPTMTGKVNDANVGGYSKGCAVPSWAGASPVWKEERDVGTVKQKKF